MVRIASINGVPTLVLPNHTPNHTPSLLGFSILRKDHFTSPATKPFTVPFGQERRSHELSVWKLAGTLFDPTGSRSDAGQDRHRRERLAKFWAALVQESSGPVDEGAPHEEKAVLYLAQRKVTEACRALLDGKDIRLGTMMSLIGSSDAFKKDMREQIEEWHDGDILSEFSVPVRVLYSLLAGHVSVAKGKKGVGIENRMDSEIISERFGLDWKQAFGLRLWYGISAEDGIAAAVDKFMEDIEQGKVPAPRPWYVEQGIPVNWEDQHRDEREDLLWGLLKVFAGRASLKEVLQPENAELTPLNFRLCWQLGQALVAVGHRVLPAERADVLTSSFATEILHSSKEETAWIAAIFVLLHLTEPAARMKAIQDVLAHHVGDLFTKKWREQRHYELLVNDLHIPATWVWQAAALHWHGKTGYSALEAECLLRASAFADAHCLFVKELAPKAVIEGHHAEVSTVLEKLKPHQHAIPGWNLGGEVYANYLDLVSQRTGGQQPESRLVESLMASLPLMYERTLDTDTTEVAAIADMADFVAKEALVLATRGQVSPAPSSKFPRRRVSGANASSSQMDLSQISRLPLTEDRQLRYSSDLASAYFREVMSSSS